MKRNSFIIVFLLFVFSALKGMAQSSAAIGGSEYQNAHKDKSKNPSINNNLKSLESILFEEYGIKVIDKTDLHSEEVLEDFLFLLKHAFSPVFIRSLKNIKYIYAYAGHDSEVDVAAFHPTENAISVGGLRAYPSNHSIHNHNTRRKILIMAALAHEIGHAFLLSSIKPKELSQLGQRYGNWRNLRGDEREDLTLFSDKFFQPYFDSRISERCSEDKNVSDCAKYNLTSAYALTNVHEWFADAFAADALQSLGKANLLGPEWRLTLKIVPQNHHEYWANYNNLSEDFVHWLRQKKIQLVTLSFGA